MEVKDYGFIGVSGIKMDNDCRYIHIININGIKSYELRNIVKAALQSRTINKYILDCGWKSGNLEVAPIRILPDRISIQLDDRCREGYVKRAISNIERDFNNLFKKVEYNKDESGEIPDSLDFYYTDKIVNSFHDFFNCCETKIAENILY